MGVKGHKLDLVLALTPLNLHLDPRLNGIIVQDCLKLLILLLKQAGMRCEVVVLAMLLYPK